MNKTLDHPVILKMEFNRLNKFDLRVIAKGRDKLKRTIISKDFKYVYFITNFSAN